MPLRFLTKKNYVFVKLRYLQHQGLQIEKLMKLQQLMMRGLIIPQFRKIVHIVYPSWIKNQTTKQREDTAREWEDLLEEVFLIKVERKNMQYSRELSLGWSRRYSEETNTKKYLGKKPLIRLTDSLKMINRVCLKLFT